MIGDRKHDLIGAIANGMRPVGVSYGYGSVDELRGAGATAIAAAPSELPALLLGDSGGQLQPGDTCDDQADT